MASEPTADHLSPPPSINPYTVLAVDQAATDDEIKRAYRKAALKHHPGVSTSGLFFSFYGSRRLIMIDYIR